MAIIPDKIAFSFQKDPHYRVVPINGVWGGPTIRGDIRVEFFYECQATPDTLVQAVKPDGTVGEIIEGQTQQVFTRTVMVGMMLTPLQADSIGKFLQEKAKVLQALQAREKKEQEKVPQPEETEGGDDGTGTTH